MFIDGRQAYIFAQKRNDLSSMKAYLHHQGIFDVQKGIYKSGFTELNTSFVVGDICDVIRKPNGVKLVYH